MERNTDPNYTREVLLHAVTKHELSTAQQLNRELLEALGKLKRTFREDADLRSDIEEETGEAIYTLSEMSHAKGQAFRRCADLLEAAISRATATQQPGRWESVNSFAERIGVAHGSPMLWDEVDDFADRYANERQPLDGQKEKGR